MQSDQGTNFFLHSEMNTIHWHFAALLNISSSFNITAHRDTIRCKPLQKADNKTTSSAKPKALKNRFQTYNLPSYVQVFQKL